MSESSRRVFLSSAAALTASPLIANATAVPTSALMFASGRTIAFTNLHTGEKMNLAFGQRMEVTGDMEKQFSRFLRDHYSGDATNMDPKLIRQLISIQQSLGIQHSHFQVISGYRSPKTNAMLRRRGARVARRSLHMAGRAIDIRLDGASLRDVRDAALELKAGGVGYYPKSSFLHIDTGRVRHW